MLQVVFYYAWMLINFGSAKSGTFTEIQFLYIVIHTGQGVFTFLIFGLDSEKVLAPIQRL